LAVLASCHLGVAVWLTAAAEGSVAGIVDVAVKVAEVVDLDGRWPVTGNRGTDLILLPRVLSFAFGWHGGGLRRELVG